MLMKAISEGAISVDSAAIQSISHCLNCRSCEAICPSQVKYGQIINQFYHSFNHKKFYGKTVSTLMRFAKSPETFNPVIAMAKLAHKTGMDKIAAKVGATSTQAAQMETFLPRLRNTQELKKQYIVNNSIGEVLLLNGCMGQTLDNTTLHDAIHLLNKLGFNVTLPRKQTCCGALHRHQGDLQTSEQMLNNINDIVKHKNYSAIVATSSACIAHIREHISLYHPFETPLMDIVEFLAQQQWQGIAMKSETIMVAYHEPCSNRNVLKNSSALTKLLNHFDCFECHPLEGNHYCCGAGGVQMISNPEQASKLRQTRIKSIKRLMPDVVISQNLSCTLNLTSGLKEEAIDIKVIHPVSLIMNAVFV